MEVTACSQHQERPTTKTLRMFQKTFQSLSLIIAVATTAVPHQQQESLEDRPSFRIHCDTFESSLSFMGQGKQDQQNLVIETPENMEHWEERRMKTIAAFGQRSPKCS